MGQRTKSTRPTKIMTKEFELLEQEQHHLLVNLNFIRKLIKESKLPEKDWLEAYELKDAILDRLNMIHNQIMSYYDEIQVEENYSVYVIKGRR